jgi:hypothetical protein
MKNKKAYVLLATILAITLAFSLIGIMFGYHWDESRIMESARQTFQTGNPLPGWYVYPSLPHDLASLVQLTKYCSFIYPGFEEAWKQHLMVRGVFILYSCAGIVFTFLLARLMIINNWLALLAAALLAFSWEFGYHARWIAPDTIMMTNVVAAVFFATEYYLVQRFRLLVYACIFGGLALASKYPAGLVFIPLFWAGISGLPKSTKNGFRIGKRIILIGGLTSLVFLVLTPGFILDFNQVVADLTEHIHIYQSGHLGHTLPGTPFDHFRRLIEYFGLAVFSPNRFLSAAVFLLVVPGVAYLRQFSTSLKGICFSFPAAYFLFFCFQDVFIVRNYQSLLPFLTILAALGTAFIWHAGIHTFLKQGIAYILVIILAFNLYFGFKAAWSIVEYEPGHLNDRVLQYIQSKDDTSFYLTERLVKKLNLDKQNLPSNTVLLNKRTKGSIPAEHLVVTLTPKRKAWDKWEAYHHNYVYLVVGPQEVNFNYYPNWAGYERGLVLPADHYKEILNKQNAD